MSLSINAAPKLPPAYKGTPDAIKGTVFAVGEAQTSKYIPGHTGAPIPDAWDDGNPKMQIVIYVVGESGKAMRLFVSKSNKEGSAWAAWVEAIKNLDSESFESIVDKTFLITCKTTYKPGGKEVAFREWGVTQIIGENLIGNLDEEWASLPKGVLPTFFYPGFGTAPATEVAPPAAPPATTAPPVVEEAAQATIYDEDIPF